MFGGLNGAAAPIVSLMGVAGLIELVTGVLIAVGLRTAIAAFIASGHMAAAYFIGHFPMGFGRLKTTANWRCFIASFFFTSLRAAPECGASIERQAAVLEFCLWQNQNPTLMPAGWDLPRQLV